MKNVPAYADFNFAEYLERYIGKRGIPKSAIARILELSYETVRSKFKKNTFSYSEVLYLDCYYPDLCFSDNYKRYLELRKLIEEE